MPFSNPSTEIQGSNRETETRVSTHRRTHKEYFINIWIELVRDDFFVQSRERVNTADQSLRLLLV